MRLELLTSLLFQVENEGQSGYLSPLGPHSWEVLAWTCQTNLGTSILWNPGRRYSKMLKVVISGMMPCLISFLVALYFEDVL